jgi:predicted nuclease of predicted toxin-antitoxin system
MASGSLVYSWRPRAQDKVIMDWAMVNAYVVFTHDLDFGILLAFLIQKALV